jgi:hypothetical protein
MKPAPQFLAPRQSVIYAHTRRMLDHTAINANSFAMAVAQCYVSTVAPDVRVVPFRLGEGDELFAAMKSNGQILRRYMDGTVKVMPADLEDAWVLALPEPFRSECERDLAQRRQRVTYQLPENATGRDFSTIAHVLSESGQLCSAWGEALADGEITEAEYARLVGESDDVMSSVLEFKAHLAERRGQGK